MVSSFSADPRLRWSPIERITSLTTRVASHDRLGANWNQKWLRSLSRRFGDESIPLNAVGQVVKVESCPK
jgi:hypothetical protein